MHPERLVHLLRVIAVIGRPISAREALRAGELPKLACNRLMQTLEQQRLTKEANNEGRYLVGERLIRIALLGKSDVDARRVAAAIIKVVTAKFSETVLPASFGKGKAEITHVETPEDPARVFIQSGLGEHPMRAYSCSKAIATFSEQHWQDIILKGSLQAYTDHTKAAREEQFAEANAVRDQDFGDCDQKIDIGLSNGISRITTENIAATFSASVVESVSRVSRNSRYNIGRRLTYLVTNANGAIQLCNVG